MADRTKTAGPWIPTFDCQTGKWCARKLIAGDFQPVDRWFDSRDEAVRDATIRNRVMALTTRGQIAK
jgi:hypothetical protein